MKSGSVKRPKSWLDRKVVGNSIGVVELLILKELLGCFDFFLKELAQRVQLRCREHLNCEVEVCV